MPAHKGSAHHRARLTEEMVREARRKYRLNQAKPAELAFIYDVTPGAMRRALRGVTWKHVTESQELSDAA